MTQHGPIERLRASTERLSAFPALYDALETGVKASKPFVVGRHKLTYGELFDRVARLTAFFAEIGLKRDTRAIIATDDDLAVIVLFMALVRNGITAVILNPEATGAELSMLVPAADAQALFVDPAIAERVDLTAAARADARVVEIGREGALPAKSLFGRRRKGASGSDATRYPGLLDRFEPAAVLPADIAESTVAYILFTSGTTSRPKGVEITHRNLFAQMATFVRQYGYDAETRLLNLLPLHHTDGLTQGPVVAFTVGATVHRPMRFRLDILPELLDSIYTARISHFITVPSVLTLIVSLGADYRDSFETPDFRFVISTAAYLDPNLWTDFEAKFATRVVNVYGLTETVCEALYCGPDEATRKIGTVGKPVDCEARIVDEDGEDVAPGAIGELVLCGDNVMKGYFRMPGETAEVLKDGWFHTGDLARRDDDGFFTIVGRKKNVIVTAGMNVYPEDVTSVLRSAPGVLDAVTLGIEDDTWGERVVSCVVPTPGETITVEGVARHFLERASREKLPKEIHIVDDLPRGPAGKVILGAVKEMVLAKSALPGENDAGEGDLESRLFRTAAAIFKAPVAELSLDSNADNTKGWNSLAHVEFLLTLEKEFGFRMTPQAIMTIQSLKDAIDVVRRDAGA